MEKDYVEVPINIVKPYCAYEGKFREIPIEEISKTVLVDSEKSREIPIPYRQD